MSCSACSARVEVAVRKLPAVADVAVNFLTGRATVHLTAAAGANAGADAGADAEAVVKAIVAAGYTALPVRAGAGDASEVFVDLKVKSRLSRAPRACAAVGLCVLSLGVCLVWVDARVGTRWAAWRARRTRSGWRRPCGRWTACGPATWTLPAGR